MNCPKCPYEMIESGPLHYVCTKCGEIRSVNDKTLWDNPMQDFDWADVEFISPKEFANPEKIAPQVVLAAAETRAFLQAPIYLTQSKDGTVRHPHGDAVHPHATSHSRYSLHKWGIDHSHSKRDGFLQSSENQLGLAIDCDFSAQSDAELFEQYLDICKMALWTGIGTYPNWHNKGFHLDLRPSDHPNYRQHWYVADGLYKKMTWKGFKKDYGKYL